MRHWREREFEKHLTPSTVRLGLKTWAFLARRPALYRWFAGLAARSLKLLGGKKRHINSLPLAGGWTAWRDMPAPQGKTFQQQWQQRSKRS
jgi:L-lactate dehydrogenase complex protein LldF